MKRPVSVFHNTHRVLAAFEPFYCGEDRLPFLFRYIPELQSVTYRLVTYDSGWPLPATGKISDYAVSADGRSLTNAESAATTDAIAVADSLIRRIRQVVDASRKLDVAYRRYIGGPLIQMVDARIDLHIAHALSGRTERLTQDICTAAGALSTDTASLNALRRTMDDNMAQDHHQFDTALLTFIQEIAA